MLELREIVAKNISELRTANKMTQIYLAERLNYSDKAVSKWERAEAIPDVTVLKEIADIFSVSVDYLLEAEHNAPPVTTAKAERIHKANQSLFTAFSIVEVWFIAAAIFAMLMFRGVDTFPAWLVFIYAIPAGAATMGGFNLFWQKSILIGAVSLSVIGWGIILSIYLSILLLVGLNLWALFIVGAPMQAIIVLFSVLIYLKKKGAKK